MAAINSNEPSPYLGGGADGSVIQCPHFDIAQLSRRHADTSATAILRV